MEKGVKVMEITNVEVRRVDEFVDGLEKVVEKLKEKK